MNNLQQHISVKIDQRSFEQAYKLYAKKLLRICQHYTGDQQEALELVQDIYESLWQRRNELEIHSLENYLVRAAKLSAFKYIRDKVAREKHTECALLDVCEASHCTEENIFYTQLSDQVTGLVDRLPCQCRNVFKLSREQGLSNKQIASTLLISEKAVEYHITKALAFLRENLVDL